MSSPYPCQGALIHSIIDCGHRLTMHNVHHLLSLMRRARNAILEDRYPQFARDFFADYFHGKGTPQWAIDALKGVGIEV